MKANQLDAMGWPEILRHSKPDKSNKLMFFPGTTIRLFRTGTTQKCG